MAFECKEPGCGYHASSRAQLGAHTRSRHPGAGKSAARTRYNLGKARERLNSGRSFGRALSGTSRLWKLPAEIIGEIAGSLTGKKGSFKQQMAAASENVRRLTADVTGMKMKGGARRRRKGTTMRKGRRGSRGTRRR